MTLGIIATIVVGIFFLIGIILLQNSKNKEKMSIFTIALSFIIMLGLIITHLLPEIIEFKNIWLIVPILIGFSLLIIIDNFIPHHHHEHHEDFCDKIDHDNHLNHIGIITIIALTIHNVIEGISLYSVTLNDSKSGILMMLSIGLHNIPLGFQIGNLIDKKNNKVLLTFLCLSTFLGSLIMILFNGINDIIISILLSLTLGMLLYIVFFEFLKEIIKNLRKKETIYGIIIGFIIIIITNII